MNLRAITAYMAERSMYARILLAIIPGYLFILSSILYAVSGPYFSNHEADPSYVYLFNSLLITDLSVPVHTDHPGTPIQALGALILVGKWFSGCFSCESLARSVLENPEDYLRAISLVLTTMIAAVLYLAAMRIYRQCGSILPSFALQLSLLLSVGLVKMLYKVEPEPMLVIAVLLLAISISRIVFGGNTAAAENCRRSDPLVAGCALGLGIASKVTFVPLLPVIILFKGWRHRIYALTATAASAVLFTAPILTQYPRVAEWLLDILIHKGRYGQGEVGLPSGDALESGVYSLMRGEPALFLLLGLYAVISILAWWPRTKPIVMLPAIIRQLVAVGVVVLSVQVAITAKHPSVRYMLPAMLFTAIVNAGLVYAFVSRHKALKYSLRWAIAALVVFVMWFNVRSVSEYLDRARSVHAVEAKIMARIQGLRASEKCIAISYYEAPLVAQAMQFGNGFAGEAYTKPLSDLYPKEVFYSFYGGGFGAFGKQITVRSVYDAVRQGRCVLLYGGRTLDADNFPLSKYLEPRAIIESARDKVGLYRLVVNPK